MRKWTPNSYLKRQTFIPDATCLIRKNRRGWVPPPLAGMLILALVPVLKDIFQVFVLVLVLGGQVLVLVLVLVGQVLVLILVLVV